MTKGTVEFFSARKGFGFFRCLELPDVFFRMRDIKRKDLLFEFDVEENNDKELIRFRAKNIKKVENGKTKK